MPRFFLIGHGGAPRFLFGPHIQALIVSRRDVMSTGRWVAAAAPGGPVAIRAAHGRARRLLGGAVCASCAVVQCSAAWCGFCDVDLQSLGCVGVSCTCAFRQCHVVLCCAV